MKKRQLIIWMLGIVFGTRKSLLLRNRAKFGWVAREVLGFCIAAQRPFYMFSLFCCEQEYIHRVDYIH